MRAKLINQLHAEVEGTCTGRYGYIITVVTVTDIGKGKVQEGTGFATFEVKYTAIVFKPFRGEVLDTTVTEVSNVSLLLEVERFII
jgi:DNA-directed RNA polymerase II subunit RPB7